MLPFNVQPFPTLTTENEAPYCTTDNGLRLVVYILGALLGTTLVLLGVVAIGLVRTCWIMRKRGVTVLTVTQTEESRQEL